MLRTGKVALLTLAGLILTPSSAIAGQTTSERDIANQSNVDLASDLRTPPPPPTPHLNGPKVYGVRPGHEFLYRIPCTGTRPITFSARSLPSPLKLDAQSGIISGTAPEKAGTYTVTLFASNSHRPRPAAFQDRCRRHHWPDAPDGLERLVQLLRSHHRKRCARCRRRNDLFRDGRFRLPVCRHRRLLGAQAGLSRSRP